LATPDFILKKNCNLQRSFLWGGASKEEKWAFVGWSKLSLPKLFGDIGLKDPSLMSNYLAANILWRWIRSLDSLWARI
jgi:hypothetical protein